MDIQYFLLRLMGLCTVNDKSELVCFWKFKMLKVSKKHKTDYYICTPQW